MGRGTSLSLSLSLSLSFSLSLSLSLSLYLPLYLSPHSETVPVSLGQAGVSAKLLQDLDNSTLHHQALCQQHQR